MRQRKPINLLPLLSFVLYSFSMSIPANAQLMSRIDCFLPVGWEGKEAKLVVNLLHQPPLIDTAIVANRHAVFTVNLIEYSPAYIWLEGNSEDIHFFLDAPRVDIAFDPKVFAQPLITGSPSSELWLHQRELLHEIDESHDKVRDDFFATKSVTDSLLVNSPSTTLLNFEPTADSLADAYNQVVSQLIMESPEAASSWYIFASHVSRLPYSKTLALFNELALFRSYSSYKQIREMLARNKVGQKAHPFDWPTTNGDTIRLADQQGKLVLLDYSVSFMASCQLRHHALIKLYAQYHPLGLEIITVSNESNREAGQESFAKENLPWPVVLSNPSAFDVKANYTVSRVPDNLLIDTHKTIIGRDMSLKDLQDTLKALLKKE
ncbi:hypothetical protein GCM10028818_37240 [Spirosoma horti]